MNPEIKEFSNDKKLAKFSVATTETYKNDDGEKVSDTQWHNVIAWGNQAKIAQLYLKKGNEIAIEGKITSRSYNDKDGVKRFITEIVANEILMIGNKNNA
jgi:single-strand DNA-binding protein